MITLETTKVKLRYEFRIDMGIVLFLNVTDNRLTRFADKLEECSQFKIVWSIHRYSDQSASIVGEMVKHYDNLKARLEIAKVFEQIFVK